MAITRVNTLFTQYNRNEIFFEPFNQCTFFNFDTNNPAIVNKVVIPPATLSGGNIFPTSFTIALNTQEVNATTFQLDFQESTTANLIIVYTQYEGIELTREGQA